MLSLLLHETQLQVGIMGLELFGSYQADQDLQLLMGMRVATSGAFNTCLSCAYAASEQPTAVRALMIWLRPSGPMALFCTNF